MVSKIVSFDPTLKSMYSHLNRNETISIFKKIGLTKKTQLIELKKKWREFLKDRKEFDEKMKKRRGEWYRNFKPPHIWDYCYKKIYKGIEICVFYADKPFELYIIDEPGYYIQWEEQGFTFVFKLLV